MSRFTESQREMLDALPRDARGIRPLHDIEVEAMNYSQNHCGHCDREYDTKYQICSDEQCSEIYGD